MQERPRGKSLLGFRTAARSSILGASLAGSQRRASVAGDDAPAMIQTARELRANRQSPLDAVKRAYRRALAHKANTNSFDLWTEYGQFCEGLGRKQLGEAIFAYSNALGALASEPIGGSFRVSPIPSTSNTYQRREVGYEALARVRLAQSLAYDLASAQSIREAASSASLLRKAIALVHESTEHMTSDREDRLAIMLGTALAQCGDFDGADAVLAEVGNAPGGVAETPEYEQLMNLVANKQAFASAKNAALAQAEDDEREELRRLEEQQQREKQDKQPQSVYERAVQPIVDVHGSMAHPECVREIISIANIACGKQKIGFAVVGFDLALRQMESDTFLQSEDTFGDDELQNVYSAAANAFMVHGLRHALLTTRYVEALRRCADLSQKALALAEKDVAEDSPVLLTNVMRLEKVYADLGDPTNRALYAKRLEAICTRNKLSVRPSGESSAFATARHVVAGWALALEEEFVRTCLEVLLLSEDANIRQGLMVSLEHDRRHIIDAQWRTRMSVLRKQMTDYRPASRKRLRHVANAVRAANAMKAAASTTKKALEEKGSPTKSALERPPPSSREGGGGDEPREKPHIATVAKASTAITRSSKKKDGGAGANDVAVEGSASDDAKAKRKQERWERLQQLQETERKAKQSKQLQAMKAYAVKEHALLEQEGRYRSDLVADESTAVEALAIWRAVAPVESNEGRARVGVDHEEDEAAMALFSAEALERLEKAAPLMESPKLRREQPVNRFEFLALPKLVLPAVVTSATIASASRHPRSASPPATTTTRLPALPRLRDGTTAVSLATARDPPRPRVPTPPTLASAAMYGANTARPPLAARNAGRVFNTRRGHVPPLHA